MSSKQMKRRYEASFMVKFLAERDHAEKFLSGAMLARRLNYFKDLEDDPARWDPNDGLRTYRHISSKPAPASKHFSHVGTISAGEHGTVRINAMEISYTTDEDPYVICLTRIVAENAVPAICLDELSQLVREAGKMGPKFGRYAVVIDNEQEHSFLEMVQQAAKDRGYEVSSEAVTYSTDELGREPLDAFCKSARFAPEHEFRIALSGGEDAGTALHLDVGNLSGIAEIVPTENLGKVQFHVPRTLADTHV